VEYEQEIRQGAVDKVGISDFGSLGYPARAISGEPHEGDRLLRLESEVGFLGKQLMRKSRFPVLLFFLSWNFLTKADLDEEIFEFFELNFSNGFLAVVNFGVGTLIIFVVSVALSALGGFILRWTIALCFPRVMGYTVEYKFLGAEGETGSQEDYSRRERQKGWIAMEDFGLIICMALIYLFFDSVLGTFAPNWKQNVDDLFGVGHYMVAFYFLVCIKNAREEALDENATFPGYYDNWEEVVESRLQVEKYRDFYDSLWDPRFLKYVKAEGQET